MNRAGSTHWHDRSRLRAESRWLMVAKGPILLGDVAQRLSSVDIACNFCGRHGKATGIRLMSEYGPATSIPTLLRLLSADCPRR